MKRANCNCRPISAAPKCEPHGQQRMPRRSARSLTPLLLSACALALGQAPGFGAVVESSGLVVIEAEHFTTRTSASGHSWVARADLAGVVGESAMQASPNTGANINTSILTTSP